MRLGITIVASFLLALAACDSEDSFFAQWDQTLQLPVGISASELPDPTSDGARLVANYCSQCHGIPSPRMHSASDWVPTLRRMVRRMEHSGHMGGMMGGRLARGMPMGMHGASIPSPAEQRVILGYLQNHALHALSEGELPGVDKPGAAVFAQTCVRCHALPDPAQHTATEWAAVVDRMRTNMRNLNMGDISESDARQIVKYLGQHTRQGGA